MKKIQKELHRHFEEIPKAALRMLIERKLTKQNLELDNKSLDALIDHLLSGNEEDFILPDEGEDQVFDLNIDQEDMDAFNNFLNRIVGEVPHIISRLSDKSARGLFKTLKENWKDEGALQKEEIRQFSLRLNQRWGDSFELLRMLLTIVRELGNEASKRYRKSRSSKRQQRRFVFLRLHARACQISDEILTLMENGFADGAMARWRTLHEVLVIMTLIEAGGEELAQRYIDHNAIDVKRQADEHDRALVPLGYLPIAKKQRENIEKAYNHYIAQYGKSFGGLYGWAAKHLKNPKPTFQDLQKSAGAAGMDLHYKLAGVNVHAGARAMFYRLTDIAGSDLLIGGRCNSGFTEPAQNTAHTLVQITAILFEEAEDLDTIIVTKTLIGIRDAIPKSLKRANKKLIADELAVIKKKTSKTNAN